MKWKNDELHSPSRLSSFTVGFLRWFTGNSNFLLRCNACCVVCLAAVHSINMKCIASPKGQKRVANNNTGNGIFLARQANRSIMLFCCCELSMLFCNIVSYMLVKNEISFNNHILETDERIHNTHSTILSNMELTKVKSTWATKKNHLWRWKKFCSRCIWDDYSKV